MPATQNIDPAYFRYEALFNHASMGIVVVDSNGIIQSVNPFAQKLFDYTIEEIREKPIEKLIPGRYHQKHVDHRNNYIHHPRSRPMGVGIDLYAIRKDGTEFPVEVSLGNYKNNNEENVIAFISDITIRKKAVEEVKKLNDEPEAIVEQRTSELTHAMRQLENSKGELFKTLEKEKELSELKSRFVTMASHEFRSPLSTVLSSVYLLEKYTSAEEQEKRDKHLQRIVSSVNTITDILNDFLCVGKIEEGKIQVKLTAFNIKELVTTIAGEMENTIRKKQKSGIVMKVNGCFIGYIPVETLS